MEDLVEKAKNGDKDAFATLVTQMQDDLYRIAETRLGNCEDVYDAVQETIIVAFKSIKHLRETSFFKTWLIRILINKTTDIYRRKKNRKFVSFDEIKMSEKYDTEMFDSVENGIDFNFICNNLKYEDRLIIILYYMENFTDKEIGRILNIKENTVTTKRTRAKEKIKKIYETGGKNYG